jgi:hypothetical protein
MEFTIDTIKKIEWGADNLDSLKVTLNNEDIIILTPENTHKIAEFIIQYNWD